MECEPHNLHSLTPVSVVSEVLRSISPPPAMDGMLVHRGLTPSTLVFFRLPPQISVSHLYFCVKTDTLRVKYVAHENTVAQRLRAQQPLTLRQFPLKIIFVALEGV